MQGEGGIQQWLESYNNNNKVQEEGVITSSKGKLLTSREQRMEFRDLFSGEKMQMLQHHPRASNRLVFWQVTKDCGFILEFGPA